jgi:MFS family permease
VLARPKAMAELLKDSVPAAELAQAAQHWGDIATSVFIAGWATGGLVFGMLGDRIGRARTMLITILLYSLCTGLSALSQTVYDFAGYRFLTGLGVGGEFAVGVALVAEVMPAAARPYALGTLQALSAVGNISAALINYGLGLAHGQGLLEQSPWRVMFVIGAVPALLALVIRSRLKEPEAWTRAQHDQMVRSQLGSYGELLSHPVWRRHALLGLVLACSGVIGLWGVGFYSPDLIRSVQTRDLLAAQLAQELRDAQEHGDQELAARLEAVAQSLASPPGVSRPLTEQEQALQRASADRIKPALDLYQSLTSIGINLGAFLGMFAFGPIAQRVGRKPTFALALIASFISTVLVFAVLKDLWHIVLLTPVMGFCQLSLFAGYAIYFPELFPTRLRSTGTSFCYNVGRFVAALGPLAKSAITSQFADYPEPMRPAGIAMCGVFLVGLAVLPFLPETRDQPLPE